MFDTDGTDHWSIPNEFEVSLTNQYWNSPEGSLTE